MVSAEEVEDAALRVAHFAYRHALDVLDETCTTTINQFNERSVNKREKKGGTVTRGSGQHAIRSQLEVQVLAS